MSAPFIHIPQSSPVSGRAHDFLDEFNRVAADPEFGASLEQLEEGHRMIELADRPVEISQPYEWDLVMRLIRDNQALWNSLLNNNFCQNYMKTRQGTNQATLNGFKWYMRQDFLYIVKQCHYEADRGLKATDTGYFKESMGRVKKRADYGESLLGTCTAAPPNGLGITDSTVLATRATEALNIYIALLIRAANNQNRVMSLVAMIPCIQSYYLIAVDLHKNSVHKDTPWYKLWVEENIKYKLSTIRQRIFFWLNYGQWKDQYAEANRIFREACQAEIGLWATALDPRS